MFYNRLSEENGASSLGGILSRELLISATKNAKCRIFILHFYVFLLHTKTKLFAFWMFLLCAFLHFFFHVLLVIFFYILPNFVSFILTLYYKKKYFLLFFRCHPTILSFLASFPASYFFPFIYFRFRRLSFLFRHTICFYSFPRRPWKLKKKQIEKYFKYNYQDYLCKRSLLIYRYVPETFMQQHG